MKYTKAERLQIANTIVAQMGGAGWLKRMVNARNYLFLEAGVQFTFSGCSKMNRCIVELLGDDTYRMRLMRVAKKRGSYEIGVNTIYDESGLYFDMLKPEFERVTGLYLSLT